LSILTAILVFKWLGLSINTMTLGGLAIAIGELVDDAVVDVENILRRLREKAAQGEPYSVFRTVVAASLEVRTAIVYATLIIALVFVPLFALPGIEGRLFVPLGIAYIVSILASLAVSVLLTPVLCTWLLPALVAHDHGETQLVRWLKAHYRAALEKVLAAPRLPIALAGLAVVLAVAAVPFFPTTFLPPFNEGSITLGLRLNPGATLSESVRIAECGRSRPCAACRKSSISAGAPGGPNSTSMPRACMSPSWTSAEAGRPAEGSGLCRHPPAPEGPAGQSQPRPADRPPHRPHAVRRAGADRHQAVRRGSRYPARPGRPAPRAAGENPRLADLDIEKQVLAPQIKVRVDFDAAARYGISTAQLTRTLQTLVDGEKVTQIVEGNRRFDLVVRLPEGARSLEG
jgi:HME family heavy-metal exporter